MIHITEKEISYLINHMIILVDTREKRWEHIRNYFDGNNIKYERRTLQSGDYSFLLKYDKEIVPFVKQIVIERKNSLTELAQCFTTSRERFQKEFQRLKLSETKCFLLIEDGEFDGIWQHKYDTRLNSKAMESSLISWLTKYNITPIFTKGENSGRVIYEILRQYLRNTAKEQKNEED